MCLASAGRQRQAMIALRRRSAAVAISRDRTSHGHVDDRNGVLLHRKLTPRASSDDHAVLTSPDAPFSNPHSPARHRHPMPARGFLPRGFSDACRPSVWLRPSAAGIQEALTTAAVRERPCKRRLLAPTGGGRRRPWEGQPSEALWTPR